MTPVHGPIHTPAPIPWGEMTPAMKMSAFDIEWKQSLKASRRRPELSPQISPYELAAHFRRLAVIQAQRPDAVLV